MDIPFAYLFSAFIFKNFLKLFTFLGVYFFYSFTFKHGLSADTISQQLESFIKAADLTAIGAWREELGKSSLRNGKC